MIIYRLSIVVGVIFVLVGFIGCSSLSVAPENITSYNNGIAIIQDSKQNSKIQFEVAQDDIGGLDSNPLLIYIITENLGENSVAFNITNVRGDMNGVEIQPLSFARLKNSDISVTTALSDFGIEVPSPNVRVSNAFFSPMAYYPFYYPFYYGGAFGYGFYDYSFSRANMYAMQERERKGRRILMSHYLRQNTLKKNEPKGGFVLFPYSLLKAGDFILKVQVGGDEYKLNIKLDSKDSAKSMESKR